MSASRRVRDPVNRARAPDGWVRRFKSPGDSRPDVQARDRYGRLLAYLWTRDGAMANVTIMGEGYAQVLTVPPNVRYQALLVACQREAREAGRGLGRRR